jgi:hypothetical protein
MLELIIIFSNHFIYVLYYANILIFVFVNFKLFSSFFHVHVPMIICLLERNLFFSISSIYIFSFLCLVEFICYQFSFKRKWARVIVLKATFNNIWVISWRSVLLVEEARVPGENYRLIASHWHTLSHNVVKKKKKANIDTPNSHIYDHSFSWGWNRDFYIKWG